MWSLHTRVNAWPSWNQEMTDASLDGPFEAGNSFTWTSYGFTVTSNIYEVDYHSRILWGGMTQGITGTHEWRFEPTPEGVQVLRETVVVPVRDRQRRAGVDHVGGAGSTAIASIEISRPRGNRTLAGAERAGGGSGMCRA